MYIHLVALVARPTNFPWRQQCESYLYDHICYISEREFFANSNFSNTKNTLNCIMQSHLLRFLRLVLMFEFFLYIFRI